MKFTDEQLKDIYRNFELSAMFTTEGKKKRIAQARKDYKLCLEAIPGLSVFDVGASGGFFLEVFRENGWLIDGSELSHKAIDYSAKEFNIKLRYGFLKDVVQPADLFIFWNTFEHLPDPAGDLALVYEHLPKGGMVYTNIPLNDPTYPHTVIFEDVDEIYKMFKDFECICAIARGKNIIHLWEK